MQTLEKRIDLIIRRADDAGVTLDDGNIIDLLADNIPASLADLRAGLISTGYASRFPKATSVKPK